MQPTLQTLSTVLVSIALASGCVVINMPPDDAGSTTNPEGDGTTGEETTDEVSTDDSTETETSTPYDLPSETESTETTTTDTDDTVDETTDGADGTCCTCPVEGPSECWSWTMTAEQCEGALARTLNVETIFCVDGDPDTCSATCPV
jgi:hypothetical protein